MTTRKILTLTLLATSLTLHAVVPTTLLESTQVQQNSVSNTIAVSLFNKGIEKKAAQQLSRNFIGNNEELFSLMVHNYIYSTGFSQQEVYTQLSKLALTKQKADFTTYGFLIKLTQSIQNSKITTQNLELLSSLSTKNTLLAKVFA